MGYPVDAAHPYKHYARSVILNGIDAPAKKVLLMPSKNCLDIQAGLESGHFNKETEFVLFERDPEIAKSIRDFCDLYNLWYRLHVTDLFSQKSVKLIQQSDGTRPFDLIFFDFCCKFNPRVNAFLQELWCRSGICYAPTAFTYSITTRRVPSKMVEDCKNTRRGDKFNFKYGHVYHSPGSYELHRNAIASAILTLNCMEYRKTCIHDFLMYKEPGKGLEMLTFTINFGEPNENRRGGFTWMSL